MPESLQIKPVDSQLQTEPSLLLLKYGFYFSILFYCYAALFPFQFVFSVHQLSTAWSHASLLPYWDTPGRRFHGIPDVAANILLTLPLGFFGFLYRAGQSRTWAIWKWCALGLVLGTAAEIVQLAIPTRSSGVTDLINNGLGAFLGAVFARGSGQHVVKYLTGTAAERRNIYLWMLICSTVAMFGPFDVSLDYFSHLRSGVRFLLADPWKSATLLGAGWLRIAGLALIGALASRLVVRGRRKRSKKRLVTVVALILLLPVALEFTRTFIESSPLSLRDLATELLGACAGFVLGLAAPVLVRPLAGFLLLNSAIIAAGLSPFHFIGWHDRPDFQWIPLYEFCSRRTPTALYELVLNLFSFAIWGGLLQLSFLRRPRWLVVAYAVALSAGVEFAQTFLPARSAGITDILMAGLGAWTGALMCAAVANSRGSTSVRE